MHFIPISGDPTRAIVRLKDLDTPVRRIFPLGRLLDAVRTRSMGLVSPYMWDDPREDLATLCMLDGHRVPERKGKQQALSAYLAPTWAQCWSLNPGSDTLLRAYSQLNIDKRTGCSVDTTREGVSVMTTVRHLLSASEGWHGAGADCHVIVGRVEYSSDEEIAQRIVNACAQHGPEFFRTIQGRVDSLLHKRKYFSHEEEVRLLMVSRSIHRTEPVRHFEIDPAVLFQSVSFDPRLAEGERRQREEDLREAGYLGTVLKDPSYQRNMYLLQMERDWVDP